MASPFAIRGIVEGFYGRPWTWAKRQSVLEFAAAHDMNLYLYAPKMEPRHRMVWREDYTASQLSRFADLIEIAHHQGVQFGTAIAAGLDIDYTSAADLNALIRKFDTFWNIGCRVFAILWDDIPPTCDQATLQAYGSLAAAQAHVVNQTHAHLHRRGERLIFMTCPTQYCGDPDCDELREFGSAVERDIHILWTGPEVCSPELNASDAQTVSHILGRAPLFWDNYPVNDMAMASEMHLEPLQGRSPGLSAHSSGLLANPMTQPEASKIVLGTVAAYVSDPIRYDPEAAWQAAAEEVAGEYDARALRVLRRGLSGNCVKPCPWERLRGDFIDVLAAWRAGAPADLSRVTEELNELAGAGRHVEAGLQNKALGRELRPWARRVRTWAEALLEALGPLDRRAAGRLPLKSDNRDMASALRTAGSTAYKTDIRTFGDELWSIVEQTIFQHLPSQWPREP